MSEKFDADLYKVKANVLDLDDTVTAEIVCGFYYKNVCDFSVKSISTSLIVTIDPYSLCRNTGIVG